MQLPRLLGAATIAFSTAFIVRPRLIAGPSGHTGPDGRVPRDTRLLMNAIGVRDIAIGAAMMCAPNGPALRAAVAARVASDLGDALVFGFGLPERAQRLKIAAAAASWAAVCAYSVRHIQD
ncbi:hypothetical protein [Allosalinactinospora lopnorensis]|uniref:hypothetical protein n=1 Tax=Allosalinactinospora lopnorensis TaxID=1352348 RepID=UPI000623D51F|nr:hypothetical protein [Allosalinactinospora lopnorensis]